MHRCIQLARKGAGFTAPNPLVGAVLVHGDRIIGEGWHQQYGEAHAEVNCIRNAMEQGHADKISASVLYVSLEPCAHTGKTPPCTDLIIRHGIPTVVIGCRDPFPEVNGKGIEKLIAAGIEVITGVLETECRDLNKRFFCFHTRHRPYVILKWAQTGDGYIAPPPATDHTINQQSQRLLISNAYTNRLVHRWRSSEAAILVGTQTALQDDPELNNRYWTGNSPVRLVLDMQLRLPASLRVFNRSVKTIVFNAHQEGGDDLLRYYRLNPEAALVPQLLEALFQLQLQSVLVEGGAQLLQSFIDAGSWDEARVITNQGLSIGSGLAAPVLSQHRLLHSFRCGTDTIDLFHPQSTHS